MGRFCFLTTSVYYGPVTDSKLERRPSARIRGRRPVESTAGEKKTDPVALEIAALETELGKLGNLYLEMKIDTATYEPRRRDLVNRLRELKFPATEVRILKLAEKSELDKETLLHFIRLFQELKNLDPESDTTGAERNRIRRQRQAAYRAYDDRPVIQSALEQWAREVENTFPSFKGFHEFINPSHE